MIAKYIILANFCLALGFIINCLLPSLIEQIIDKRIALSNDSQTFPLWREPPVPVYQKFYFYNVTNAHQIEHFGHRPSLAEIGPFTYRTAWSRRDIEFNQQGDTINFKNFKTWHFEPELSVADHSLEITTLNAPLAITLTLIQSASNAVRLLVTFSLDGLSDGFFTKRSIKQLLFDGYPDLLTTFGPLLNAEMLSQGGKFGYMNARNNSLDGTYEVNTGSDDIGKLNSILTYNGRARLPYWHDSPQHCNSLEGASLGELFPPARPAASGLGPGPGPAEASPLAPPDGLQSVKLFQPDFCRVWRLDLESEFEQPSSGLRLRRFRASRDVFKNSSELPENSCFFAPTQHHSRRGSLSSRPVNNQHHRNGDNNSHHNRAHSGNRVGRQNRQAGAGPPGAPPQRHSSHHRPARPEWPAGVFSLAPCKFNAPIYMSMPHFLDADPHYLSQLDGLAPEASKHEFFVDLEPRSGAPVRLAARVQLNVAISKPPGLVRFRNVPEIMFPVFWQELTVNLSGPVLDQLYLASRGAQEINRRISYVLLILGTAILVTSCLFYLHEKLLSSRSESGDKD